MKNSLRIHKWTHNEFNIFILGVLTHPLVFCNAGHTHGAATARHGANAILHRDVLPSARGTWPSAWQTRCRGPR